MTLSELDYQAILEATKDTFILVGVTGLFILVIGIILGLTLFFTQYGKEEKKSGILSFLHFFIGSAIDILRSIPFVILLILIIPLTILLMGTMLGYKAALPALIISASPFYARLVYNALKDVPASNIEVLESMGASLWTKIVYLLKEALPSLVSGLSVTLVTLIGFIASAGAIGGGGLGDLAVKRAFVRDYDVMYISIAVLLVSVLVIQISGELLSRKIDKR